MGYQSKVNQERGAEDRRARCEGYRGNGSNDGTAHCTTLRFVAARYYSYTNGPHRGQPKRQDAGCFDSRRLEPGSELDSTLTLSAEITHGSDVFVRALGKVVRVERRIEDGSSRMGVAAVIERYDIIRGENGRA